jgi:hypothetical protein
VLIGSIATQDHSHVDAILRLGLEIRFTVGAVEADRSELLISIEM